MSIIGSNILAGSSGQGGAYEIEQSLRFDGAQSLAFTPSPAGSRTTWTLSFWFKRTKPGEFQTILAAPSSGSTDDTVRFEQGDRFKWFLNDTGDGTLDTSALYRDPSAWAHYVFVADYSNSTANDRNRMYINGAQVTDFHLRTNAPLNYSGAINNAIEHFIGRRKAATIYYLKGYLAEMHFLDGTAVTDALDFGEYDNNGVWRPVKYTGSYGSQGYYLKFDPSATNGLGHDHSGNGNDWTASGFTTSGTGTDVMSDTPTTNYCTLNPLDNSGTTQSDGNLVTTKAAAGYESIRATFGMSSGKWYWESTRTSGSGNNLVVGIVDNAVITDYFDRAATGYGYRASDGYKTNNNTGSAYGNTYAAGDVIGVAFDADNGDLFFYKNGTVQNSGTAAFTGLTAGPYFPAIAVAGGDVNTVNFGQRAFEYTPPTGFKALNTANLPEPDIADGSDYFNTVLYTGNDSNPRSFTDLKWKPDFVWIKIRSQAYYGGIFDSVRGAGGSKRLYPSENFAEGGTTGAEGTFYGALTSFDNFGFTVDTGSTSDIWVNDNNETYVAWNWLANGSGSSNTDGSITSTVSANQTAGFSIVSYTGDGDSAATVGHGLGVAPNFVILKRRTGGTANWQVAEDGSFGSKELYLNGTDGYTDGANEFSVTSTVIDLNSSHFGSNASGSTYIAYCFANVEGYSKFGKYVSNNSADGPFVFCGFKPELVWLKKTSATSNWFMYDAARNEYNVTGNKLYADSSAAENGEDGGSTTSNTIDILSNGFKLRTNNGTNNGGDYIFCAWAQHPFGGSGVSPATAR